MKKYAFYSFFLVFIIMSIISCSSPFGTDNISLIKCGDREFGEWEYYYTIDLTSGEVIYHDFCDKITESIKTMNENELAECKTYIKNADFSKWGKVSYWKNDYEEVEKCVDGCWAIEITTRDGKELSFAGYGITPERGAEFERALKIAGIDYWSWD